LMLVTVSIAYAEERDIAFESEDGWELHATLHMPDSASEDHPVAGVILLPSPKRERQVFGMYAIPGLSIGLEKHNVASLRLDYRGIGESVGDFPFPAFTPEQRDKVRLDVMKAIEVFTDLDEVDSMRIALVGDTFSATPIVTGSEGHPSVQAYVFLAGHLSDEAKEILAQRPEMPLLALLTKEDRVALRDSVDVYLSNQNSASDLRVFDNMGSGTSMFLRYRNVNPDRTPLDVEVVDWLVSQVKGLGYKKEVSFKTEDGFTIYGNLRMPDNASEEQPVAGAVLLHSGLSDRNVLFDLEMDLARNNIAVLNIDWRGRGKSKGKGIYFFLDEEQQNNAYLDAKAAINFLAEQDGVDENRMGIFGTVLGAVYGSGGGAGDPRIKTMVLVSSYSTSQEVTDSIATREDLSILCIDSEGSTEAEEMKNLCALSKNPESRLMLFPGGGHGFYQIPGAHAPAVKWLVDKLK
jgi:cephalosporin-C deacetylase-like acetyl esterase